MKRRVSAISETMDKELRPQTTQTLEYHGDITKNSSWRGCRLTNAHRRSGVQKIKFRATGKKKFEKWLQVRKSLTPLAGKGLFADRNFSLGDVICMYTGTQLAAYEKTGMGFLVDIRNRDPFTVTDARQAHDECQKYIDSLPQSRYQYTMKLEIHPEEEGGFGDEARRVIWLDGRGSKTGCAHRANCWVAVQHSNEQLNCEVITSEHGGLMVARRDISEGEELLWDYNYIPTW